MICSFRYLILGNIPGFCLLLFDLVFIPVYFTIDKMKTYKELINFNQGCKLPFSILISSIGQTIIQLSLNYVYFLLNIQSQYESDFAIHQRNRMILR
ncbi:unnamed protein product [Paramecium octaurelia]|uniref:Uncharacterized protein n=1 Tax=Paramecium octaurelia TaxID=43137 RepID=A0A8S1YIP2_PAROT|nr:unnamed protein product [Paramecium octaurelia]